MPILAENVCFLTTPRYISGGASSKGYANFNLATHVGDNVASVKHNRKLLREKFHLPSEPKWLLQTHKNCCVLADDVRANTFADASFTYKKGVVCAILSADCLPIFLSSKKGDEVAIIHAGYKGLLAGVIEQTVKKLTTPKTKICAYLGVAISQSALRLDEDLYQQFLQKNADFSRFFVINNRQKNSAKDVIYYLDLYQLARFILNDCGIIDIASSNACTFREKERYFSYRRQAKHSGRMASLIWLK